jgi:hypothetical protein
MLFDSDDSEVDAMFTSDDDNTPEPPSSSRNPYTRKRVASQSPVNEQAPPVAQPDGKRWKGKGRANNEQEGQSPPIFSDPTKPSLEPIPEAAVEKLLALKTKSRSQNRLDFIFKEIRGDIPAEIHSSHVKTAITWFVKLVSAGKAVISVKDMKKEMSFLGFPIASLKKKRSFVKAFMCSSWYPLLLLI